MSTTPIVYTEDLVPGARNAIRSCLRVHAEHDAGTSGGLGGRACALDACDGPRRIRVPAAGDDSLGDEIGGDRTTRLPQAEQRNDRGAHVHRLLPTWWNRQAQRPRTARANSCGRPTTSTSTSGLT